MLIQQGISGRRSRCPTWVPETKDILLRFPSLSTGPFVYRSESTLLQTISMWNRIPQMHVRQSIWLGRDNIIIIPLETTTTTIGNLSSHNNWIVEARVEHRLPKHLSSWTIKRTVTHCRRIPSSQSIVELILATCPLVRATTTLKPK